MHFSVIFARGFAAIVLRLKYQSSDRVLMYLLIWILGNMTDQ